jgi:hypothetical protein
MPLMLGRGWTRLDVTGGRHRLYLGTHISNSARQTSTVLFDPCAISNSAVDSKFVGMTDYVEESFCDLLAGD